MSDHTADYDTLDDLIDWVRGSDSARVMSAQIGATLITACPQGVFSDGANPAPAGVHRGIQVWVHPDDGGGETHGAPLDNADVIREAVALLLRGVNGGDRYFVDVMPGGRYAVRDTWTGRYVTRSGDRGLTVALADGFNAAQPDRMNDDPPW